MPPFFSGWLRRRSRTSRPINAQWLADQLGQFHETFDATYDEKGRLTYFGSGKDQCISLDPEKCEAERTYDQYREIYEEGEAESFDAWSDNDEPIRVDFWLWAELRVLEIFKQYLANTGYAYHQAQAETRDDERWLEGYEAACERAEAAVRERQAQLPGGEGVFRRFRAALSGLASSDPSVEDTSSEFQCSFCGKKASEVMKLVAGPRVFICNQCLRLTSEIIATDNESDTSTRASNSDEGALGGHPDLVPASAMHCTFCGKGAIEVQQMIAGPSVYICNECVDIGIDIIEKKAAGETA